MSKRKYLGLIAGLVLLTQTLYAAYDGFLNAPANTVNAGPASGASGTATYRALVVNDFNSGTAASSSTFWRGDGTWATPAGTAYTFADSLVNTAGTVTLVNDSASPTASQYYGTNAGSVLGYYNLPAAGSGTVTSVSVVSANGFAGTVATATSTPAITLTTTITGLLKGNGTAISAATAGTDYQAPISTSTGAANQFVTGFTAPNTFTYAQPAFSNLSGNITAAQMLALASADIYVGNGSNQPAAVAPSGGFTINNTGVATLGNTAVTGQALTGYTAGSSNSAVVATDTILQAFQKIAGNLINLLDVVTTVNPCSTSYAINPNLGGMFNITLSGACAISVTSLSAGHSFMVRFNQTSTTAPTFSSAFKFMTAPTWSIVNGQFDDLMCASVDGTRLECGALTNVQ